jgi:uncharacterized protein (TIRG00374 family)
MSKKITITFAIGLIISVATLYLAFRNVPFAELVNYLLSINYFWILPAAVLILISFVIRALRWQFILGSHQHVSFRHAFHPLMIGFMINCVLPGRVGEVARPAILKNKENVPFATGLATVAAERLIDVGILIILFVALFAQMEIDPALGISFGGYTLNSDTLKLIFKGLLRLTYFQGPVETQHSFISRDCFDQSSANPQDHRMVYQINSGFIFFYRAKIKEQTTKANCNAIAGDVGQHSRRIRSFKTTLEDGCVFAVLYRNLGLFAVLYRNLGSACCLLLYICFRLSGDCVDLF